MQTRHVIVSGAGTGIGKATAAPFARRGDRVVILGRRADVLARAADEINSDVSEERVTWQSADLTEPDVVQQLEFPSTVDVVVNNAGGVHRGDEQGLASPRSSARTGSPSTLSRWATSPTPSSSATP